MGNPSLVRARFIRQVKRKGWELQILLMEGVSLLFHWRRITIAIWTAVGAELSSADALMQAQIGDILKATAMSMEQTVRRD
jgi:hypothetical protein